MKSYKIILSTVAFFVSVLFIAVVGCNDDDDVQNVLTALNATAGFESGEGELTVTDVDVSDDDPFTYITLTADGPNDQNSTIFLEHHNVNGTTLVEYTWQIDENTTGFASCALNSECDPNVDVDLDDQSITFSDGDPTVLFGDDDDDDDDDEITIEGHLSYE